VEEGLQFRSPSVRDVAANSACHRREDECVRTYMSRICTLTKIPTSGNTSQKWGTQFGLFL